MSDLYDDDILLWSERQAQLLRRLAAGERVNDQVDWENVIEEVESVGSEQLHAVELLLVQALVHMLKAEGWPNSRDAPNWRAEAGTLPRRCRRPIRTVHAAADRPCAPVPSRAAGPPGNDGWPTSAAGAPGLSEDAG